jgi:hypothetical protein
LDLLGKADRLFRPLVRSVRKEVVTTIGTIG